MHGGLQHQNGELLKELHALLQPTGVQPEPTLIPTPVPILTPVSVPTTSAQMMIPSANRPDPMLQEEIPEINMEDIASLGGRRSRNHNYPNNRKSGYKPSGQPIDTRIGQRRSAEKDRGTDEEESRGVDK